MRSAREGVRRGEFLLAREHRTSGSRKWATARLTPPLHTNARVAASAAAPAAASQARTIEGHRWNPARRCADADVAYAALAAAGLERLRTPLMPATPLPLSARPKDKDNANLAAALAVYVRGGDPERRLIRAGVEGEGDGSRPGVVGSLCEPTRWAMHGSCCRRLRVWEGYNRNPQASRGMLRRAGGAPARRTRRPGSTCIQARTLPWLTPRSRRAKVAPRWFRRSTY